MWFLCSKRPRMVRHVTTHSSSGVSATGKCSFSGPAVKRRRFLRRPKRMGACDLSATGELSISGTQLFRRHGYRTHRYFVDSCYLRRMSFDFLVATCRTSFIFWELTRSAYPSSAGTLAYQRTGSSNSKNVEVDDASSFECWWRVMIRSPSALEFWALFLLIILCSLWPPQREMGDLDAVAAAVDEAHLGLLDSAGVGRGAGYTGRSKLVPRGKALDCFLLAWPAGGGDPICNLHRKSLCYRLVPLVPTW